PLELPRLVAEEAIRLYNAPSTTRLVGRSRLPRGNEWRGDVAVRNGAVWVGGRVQGTVLVINGDAVLDSTAAITGDLIVVGGSTGRSSGTCDSGWTPWACSARRETSPTSGATWATWCARRCARARCRPTASSSARTTSSRRWRIGGCAAPRSDGRRSCSSATIATTT